VKDIVVQQVFPIIGHNLDVPGIDIVLFFGVPILNDAPNILDTGQGIDSLYIANFSIASVSNLESAVL